MWRATVAEVNQVLLALHDKAPFSSTAAWGTFTGPLRQQVIAIDPVVLDAHAIVSLVLATVDRMGGPVVLATDDGLALRRNIQGDATVVLYAPERRRTDPTGILCREVWKAKFGHRQPDGSAPDEWERLNDHPGGLVSPGCG